MHGILPVDYPLRASDIDVQGFAGRAVNIQRPWRAWHVQVSSRCEPEMMVRPLMDLDENSLSVVPVNDCHDTVIVRHSWDVHDFDRADPGRRLLPSIFVLK